MASFEELQDIDVDLVKEFLGITEDSHDDLITSSIPFYSYYIIRQIGVELSTLTEGEIEFIQAVISLGIACHLMKAIPDFGLPLYSWKLGDAQKMFQPRRTLKYDTWCDLYDDFFNEFLALFAIQTNTAKRLGVIDEYSRPY